MYNYNKVGELDGLPNRDIIEADGRYYSTHQENYTENSYIYIQNGKVQGVFIPLGEKPAEQTASRKTRLIAARSRTRLQADGRTQEKIEIHTTHGYYEESLEPYRILEEGDQLIVSSNEVKGFIEHKPKWEPA